MTNVYLYGELRNKFGNEFKFNVNSAKEALLAINSNRKGFLDEVKRLAIKGVHYRIVIDDTIIQHPKEVDVQKTPKEIHIVPIVWGAGKNGAAIGMLVVGVALIAATGGLASIGISGMSAFTGAAAGSGMAALGTTLGMIGASLAVQGVMSLLFPQPKPDFNQEVQAGGKSYLFGNKPSNTSQGQAVPVGYGRLKIGASQISAGTDHYKLDTDIKQLMTPIDKPTNDYIELIAEDETQNSSAGMNIDAFSTKQAVDMEDTVTFSSVNVLNSYIDITTNSASKVVSNPVEVVVKRNNEIISNPDLTTWDQNVTYTWEELSNDSSKGNVFIENPYVVKSGLAIRSYQIPDFKVQSEYKGLTSNQDGYFKKYAVGDLVKFGPTQFKNLKFGTWDPTYTYYSGELIDYATGSDANTYFQAVTGNFSGELPTGLGPSINSTYWRKILPPNLEYLYKCAANISGHLPNTGAVSAGVPVAESTFWTRIDTPTDSTTMDTLFSDYPACEDKNQTIYVGDVNIVNGQNININGTDANIDNYGMEFLGYFYVPSVGGDGKTFVKDIYEIGTATGLYEIIQVGNTGQWSGIGFTGAGGVALTPKIGSTFHKNSTQGTGDGKVMLVGEYQFKLDSDDASDLYIDSTLASSYYGGHGMFSGFADPFKPTSAEIAALPSTTTSLYLTAGYHRLFARLQEARGGEGISFYYKYDTNRDGVFSDWMIVPKEKLFHSSSDLSIPKNQKYGDVGKRTISVSNTISGKRYKILSVSSTNWTSIGSAIGNAQTVFVKNATSPTSSGTVVEDFITYAEEKSAESNRLVRFVSQRPKINGVTSLGYSIYKSRYRCKVNINNKQILYSSPVKVNIQFLSTKTSAQGTTQGVIPIEVQTN